jgi:CAAX protease family protein
MNINKPSAQPDSPRRGLLARYPLTFYFIIAYAGTWLVWSLFVFSQNGAGLLPFRSPMSYMLIVFLGQIFGPTLAAVAMTGVTEGKPGLRRFLGRTVRWRVGIPVVSVRSHRHSSNRVARHNRSAGNLAVV